MVTPVPPWLLAVALIIALLVLIPARRLQLSDVSARWIGLYALVLWTLGMVAVIRPVGARVLVPFLLVLYLAPFVAGPDRVRRFLDRGGWPGGGRPGGGGRDPRRPIKDVTPPESRDHP